MPNEYDAVNNPTGTQAPAGYVNPNAAMQNVPATNAATPPQTTTPVSPDVNPNANYMDQFKQPAATTTTQAETKPDGSKTATTTKVEAAAQPLTMPQNGSVVDLLNAAGTDSSFESRKKLAADFGIQAYTGTASQNQELSKKYLEAFNANKSSPLPETGSAARSAINTYFDSKESGVNEDPQASFFDAYASMNPVVKQLYDTINQELSSTKTRETFQQEFQSLMAAQGIPALQTELMNINNIMEGTEDDIRDEITKAGGFATESQVQAMKGARNKTLLKQANNLQQQLALKEDYVNQIMNFSKLDREEVEKQVDRKLGLSEKLYNLQTKLADAAHDNYQKVVDKVGYDGLSTILGGDKKAQGLAERALGLPAGALSNPELLEFLTGGKEFQFISGTENQAAGIFDKTTGTFKPLGGGGGGRASAPTSNQALLDTADALASSFGTKFQKEAFMKSVNAMVEQGNTQGAAELIFSRAIQQIPDAEQRKKVTGRYEMVKRLNNIESLLTQYYAKGGKTDIFRGTTQKIKERLGNEGNPELAKIGTSIANAMDELVRFRTGAALTEHEEDFYKRLLPGTFKTAQLNKANIDGLRESLAFDVENSLQNQLTTQGYADVAQYLGGSPIGVSSSNTIRMRGPDGVTYNVPSANVEAFIKAGGTKI